MKFIGAIIVVAVFVAGVFMWRNCPRVRENHVYQNVVVGAGLSGAVLAERLAASGEEVLVIERRPHIGGNVYDYRDKNDILIQKYGAHIFHTNNAEVWHYLSRFTVWNPVFHKVSAVIDGKAVVLPFNFNTLYAVFPPELAARLENKLLEKFPYGSRIPISKLRQEEGELRFLADFIYEKVYASYSKKQWGNEYQATPEALARVPVVLSRDDRYFDDVYQGIPAAGYTQMIKNMLEHPNITVVTGVDFNEVRNKLKFKRLFYTGSIDAFFNYEKGMLPYRSLHFETVEKNMPFYQETAVVNYPNNYDFTRVLEYKRLTGGNSDKTVVAFEYPEAFEPEKNERFYPIGTAENAELYNAYRRMAEGLENVYFLGRLGDYKYYDMDEAVERALAVFAEVSSQK